MLPLATELKSIRELSPRFAARLARLGLRTVRDVLWHFPFRYEDFSRVVKIADLKLQEVATVRGVVKQIAAHRSWRRKVLVTEALIADETGGIRAVWFNQPYIAHTLKEGRVANFAGKVALGDDDAYLASPSYDFSPTLEESAHTAGLIPIYPETKGLTSKGIRFLVKPLLKAVGPLPDFIPETLLRAERLPSRTEALHAIHFPETLAAAEAARRRFAFEDLYLLQLANLKARAALRRERAPALAIPPETLAQFMRELPFALTRAQKRSIEEIASDLGRPEPMNRLLQGDVGSGKTAVAALASRIAHHCGTQIVCMAPTEVLARQHYRTLRELLSHAPVGVGLAVSNETRLALPREEDIPVRRAAFLKAVREGQIHITVGTHALIAGRAAGKITFRNLGLVIIDEQHRFGVRQRQALVREGTQMATYLPHFLSMSATPIPRTLALSFFGDLDLSTLDELPAGRIPILTKIVPPAKRATAYAFIRQEIRKGRQAFVLCPRIEPAPADEKEPPAPSSLQQQWARWEVKSVEEEYDKLRNRVFPDLRVAMLHGKLKAAEKAATMAAFAAGTTDVLVSTSVIEVGIDVPNATIMMVEGAERFGLAQLYQFRGRVGRGAHQSYCLLFTDSSSESTARRLRALLTAKNGFALAEEDLKLRGPGEFLGDKQTGLPDIAMTALQNMELLRGARRAAEATLNADAELASFPLLREKLAEFERRIHLE